MVEDVNLEGLVANDKEAQDQQSDDFIKYLNSIVISYENPSEDKKVEESNEPASVQVEESEPLPPLPNTPVETPSEPVAPAPVEETPQEEVTPLPETPLEQVNHAPVEEAPQEEVSPLQETTFDSIEPAATEEQKEDEEDEFLKFINSQTISQMTLEELFDEPKEEVNTTEEVVEANDEVENNIIDYYNNVKSQLDYIQALNIDLHKKTLEYDNIQKQIADLQEYSEKLNNEMTTIKDKINETSQSVNLNYNN